MHTLVFIAPAVATLVSLAVYYVTRPADLAAVSLRLAEEETRTETENEAWARALTSRHPCNVTMRGY